jgi:hypothetical protein
MATVDSIESSVVSVIGPGNGNAYGRDDEYRRRIINVQGMFHFIILLKIVKILLSQ